MKKFSHSDLPPLQWNSLTIQITSPPRSRSSLASRLMFPMVPRLSRHLGWRSRFAEGVLHIDDHESALCRVEALVEMEPPAPFHHPLNDFLHLFRMLCISLYLLSAENILSCRYGSPCMAVSVSSRIPQPGQPNERNTTSPPLE